MELVRGLHNIRSEHFGCVLSIGNFDGVHRGHQQVLRRLKQVARQYGQVATVMLFEPQPREFFAPDTAPARLTLLRDKCVLLAELGIERLICVPFNAHFAALTAEAFIHEWLVNKLGVKFLAVGDDFRFGQARQGDFALLQQAGVEHGFTVANSDSFCVNGTRVSSTLIREALAQGALTQAEEMLGRPYHIHGRVAHGDEIGRRLGFPTANVLLKRRSVPVQGVYAVLVHGLSERPLPAMANIGHRPTLDRHRQQLEVHIFDFNDDIYGRHIDVELCVALRAEQRFASLDALRQQLVKDKQAAIAWLEAH